MKSKIILSVIIFAFFVSFSYVSAQVPQMISYQGKITTPAGLLIDTTVSMTFSIYADPLGMPPSLWGETQDSVKLEKGAFSVLLGSVNPIPDSIFDGNTLYLAVKVGDDPTMTPLKPIVSVAYAITDGDWRFRITDTADTTLMTGGRWGIARYGNKLWGTNDSTHVNLGVACTTGTSGQNSKYCTVGGGLLNTASYDYATVGGGGDNTASGNSATVAGGVSNTASYDYATVGGGNDNTASGNIATVAGGMSNSASGYIAAIGGGSGNTASYNVATVGGGYHNTASGLGATIPGGFTNTAAGDWSFATGSLVNVTSDADYTFAFGNNFTTSASHAVIFHDTETPIKVGIGTASPTQTLDVTGSVAISGNLGVGTTSPNTKFEVRGDNQTIRHATSSDPGRYIQMGYNGSIGPLIEGDGYNRLTLDADAGAAGQIVLGQNDDKVGIGTINPQGALDVNSTTGALIVPRMTTVQRTALTAVNGMIIYNTTTNQFNFYEAGAWVTK